MKKLNQISLAVLLAVASFTVLSFHAETAFAKRNRGGRAAEVTAPDVRMIAAVETEAAEAVAKYRHTRGRYKLVFGAEGLAVGEVVEAYFNGQYVGSIEMAISEEDPTTTAGELEFVSRDGDMSEWAQGVPLDISMGTEVSFILPSGEELVAYFEEK